ncbi:MAG: 16S rRNA (cytosine(967)-C(5))-methyltransferase RsmB [Gammaproteobacteria bacterium]|jgi:16S rRNA (cytosine967-C5)-methyltransferase|nr:16S rRNA (cytosine(967)-C(5))-methyltransferase RsmB [Gammaproteobacteria bacterium]
MADPTRYLAALAITEVLREQGSLAASLPLALTQAEAKERALLSQMVYGTCRYYPQLNSIAQHLLNKPLRNRDLDIYALMLVGLYELSHMRTPHHAAVGSCVEAAKASGQAWAPALINGVLRAFLRQRETLPQALEDTPEFHYNHPHWLQVKLANHWPDYWQAILCANDQQAPMTLRVNQRHHTTPEYLALLAKANIQAKACTFSPWGVQLANSCQVDELPGFAQGWVSVQDEAPQLAPTLLDLQTGQRVLDACAAPGGKTGHLLEIADVQVTAVELEQRRIGRLHDNLQRLQLSAEVICADASQPESWWDGQAFERILLDAPCSATGVIRRNPDIKLLRSNEDITRLAQLQLTLLQQLWPTLAPGGLLVYATCSVLRQENERIIKRFLQAQEDAQQQAIVADWGQATDYGRQLFPRPDGHDGFYYAVLKKAFP